MKRGPKGASIETQLEVTATRTWRFTREELVKRLGLPENTKFHVATVDGQFPNDVASIDVGSPLVAIAVETRAPKVTT